MTGHVIDVKGRVRCNYAPPTCSRTSRPKHEVHVRSSCIAPPSSAQPGGSLDPPCAPSKAWILPFTLAIVSVGSTRNVIASPSSVFTLSCAVAARTRL